MRRHDQRPFALLVLIGCLLFGTGILLVDRISSTETRVRVVDDPTAFAANVSTATSAGPTTTQPPAGAAAQGGGRTIVYNNPHVKRLPVPRAAPRDGAVRDNRAVVQIGSIEIPKIGLVHPVFEGNTLTQIDHGPSHWPGTAFPGQAGNAVFAGHRVTHSHPFLHIDKLAVGDPVVFTIQGVRTVYHVSGTQVVTPKDTWIVQQTPTPTATLFACHPPHSAKYRFVVKLKLEGT